MPLTAGERTGLVATILLGGYLLVGAPGVYRSPEMSRNAERALELRYELHRYAHRLDRDSSYLPTVQRILAEKDAIESIPDVREQLKNFDEWKRRNLFILTLLRDIGAATLTFGVPYFKGRSRRRDSIERCAEYEIVS